MKRLTLTPRADWRMKVERLGFTYHTHDRGPYWDESACYSLSEVDVQRLEQATKASHRLCLEAAEWIVTHAEWPALGLSPAHVPLIMDSWERDDFSLYGRFDFAYDGEGPPKLLEYNADTPTALVEAAVVQWHWLQDRFPHCDQFNSLHERLVAAWQRSGLDFVHFAGIGDHPEDEQTLFYLQDTFLQAGGLGVSLRMEDIGWDGCGRRFLDRELRTLERCFKLYPWEWLVEERFGAHLKEASTRWLEPPWKMLLSNKALLPLLWKLFPEHPNLLPAYLEPGPLGGSYVQKPFLSREGANVVVYEGGTCTVKTAGDYGEGPSVYQALAKVPEFDGHRPIFGSWIVDHEPAGVGIREDRGQVTGNLSRFVPHFIA